MDRIAISAAKTQMTADLHLSDIQMGWVLSIFAIGYALFQIPVGMLADKLGSRIILTSVVFSWSLFTGLTGIATSFVFLLFIRFLFGASEAGAFPGIARIVYTWMPMKERGIAQGINFSGSRFGAAFTLPFIAWLIVSIGWRSTFIVLMIIGFLWSIFWFFWFRDDPVQDQTLSKNERNYILQTRQLKNQDDLYSLISFKSMFTSLNMWYLMVQYFCSNFTFFFCITWGFPYLKSTYLLTTQEASFYTAIPLLFGAFGNIFSGWLVDKIYKHSFWILSRRVPAILGFICAAIGIIGCGSAPDIQIAIAFLSLAIFGADMTLCSSWSTCIDIGKKNAGVVSGTMNMAGNIGAFITALFFPYLQHWTGSTIPFFVVGSALNGLAVLLWIFIDPKKVLFRTDL